MYNLTRKYVEYLVANIQLYIVFELDKVLSTERNYQSDTWYKVKIGQ